MRRLALLAPLLLAGCLKFADDGVYACVPTTGKDCTVCDQATGWCQDWSGVKLGAAQLRGIWGSASDSIWAVGSNGTILFWNGKVWTSQGRQAPVDLNGVWGRSPTDVWVVGNAASYLHWDGASWGYGVSTRLWTGRQDNPLQDLLAVGGNQNYTWTVESWGGSAFWDTAARDWALFFDYQAGRLPLYGIWSDSQANTYYVGQAGKVFRDAAANTSGSGVVELVNPDLTTPRNDLYAIWGSSPTDVWIVGDGGIVLHWDNGPAPATPLALKGNLPSRARAIWGTGSNDIWVAGDGGKVSRWNGAAFESVPQNYADNLRGIWVNSKDVWAVAESGIIYHLER